MLQGGPELSEATGERRRRNRENYMPRRALLSKCVGVVNVGEECHRNCAGVVNLNLRSSRLRETLIFEDNVSHAQAQHI